MLNVTEGIHCLHCSCPELECPRAVHIFSSLVSCKTSCLLRGLQKHTTCCIIICVTEFHRSFKFLE